MIIGSPSSREGHKREDQRGKRLLLDLLAKERDSCSQEQEKGYTFSEAK